MPTDSGDIDTSAAPAESGDSGDSGNSGPSGDQSVYLTMINPLRRRRAIPPALFFDYWRDAHVQIASRLPGIDSLRIHQLDYDSGACWPAVPGVERDLPEIDRFDGVPEPTFLSQADLDRFGGAMGPLMRDEANIFERTIGYQSLGPNSKTFVDHLTDPEPNGDEGVLRFLVFYRRSPSVDVEAFRSFLSGPFAGALAKSQHLLKVRLHLLEAYVSDEVFLDAEGVSHYLPPERQHQACLEVVFADALALSRLAASELWLKTQAAQRDHFAAAHPFRVFRHYCMRRNGRLTLTGQRTAAVADQIRRVGALNQFDEDVVKMFDLPSY